MYILLFMSSEICGSRTSSTVPRRSFDTPGSQIMVIPHVWPVDPPSAFSGDVSFVKVSTEVRRVPYKHSTFEKSFPEVRLDTRAPGMCHHGACGIVWVPPIVTA